MSEDGIRSIDPNLCPGGVVVRIYCDEEFFVERKLVDAQEAAVIGDVDQVAAKARAQHTILIRTWDGDDGGPRVVHELMKVDDEWVSIGHWMSEEFRTADMD
jgi:hypothetical protein